MDALSASVGVGELIRHIDKNKNEDGVVFNSARSWSEGKYTKDDPNQLLSTSIYNSPDYHSSISRDLELERISRQVVQEIQDSRVYKLILKEAQSLFDESSDRFPKSVKRALRSCVSHQEMVQLCRHELVTVETRVMEIGIIKEYQKSFLEASKAFGQSVLLFRQLIIGSRDTNISVFYNGDYTNVYNGPEAKDSRTEAENIVGGLRFHSPQNASFSLNTFHNGSVTNVQQEPTATVHTSPGQEVKKILGKWSITFSTGLVTGKRWSACRAIPDTGSDGNWIKHDVLVDAGLKDYIQDVEGDPMISKDASGHEHRADKFIDLSWYRNEEVTIRSDRFFVAHAIPVPMIFGKEFINANLAQLFPEAYAQDNPEEINEDEHQEGDLKTILPNLTRLKPKNKAQRAAEDKKAEGRRKADAEAEEKRRQAAAIALAARFDTPVKPNTPPGAEEPSISNVTAPAAAADNISLATVSTATTELTSGRSSVANASSRTLSSTESIISSVVDIPGTVIPTDKTGMSASIEQIRPASEQA